MSKITNAYKFSNCINPRETYELRDGAYCTNINCQGRVVPLDTNQSITYNGLSPLQEAIQARALLNQHIGARLGCLGCKEYSHK